MTPSVGASWTATALKAGYTHTDKQVRLSGPTPPHPALRWTTLSTLCIPGEGQGEMRGGAET